MNGYVYTIDDADRQVTVQFDGQAVNKPCWIQKSGQSC
jgi:hypothetical protein